MTEERNQTEKTQTIVEVQNHENQNDSSVDKIILTITCNGSKLTKADSGYDSEITQDVWVSTKMTKADSGKIRDIDVNVHERCGAKLTKADAGRV